MFSYQPLTGGQVRTCEGWIKESSGLVVGMTLQCDIGKHLPQIRALTVVVWTGQTDCTEPRKKARKGMFSGGIGAGV